MRRYVIVFSDGYRSDPLDWDCLLSFLAWACRRDYGIRPVRVEAAA